MNQSRTLLLVSLFIVLVSCGGGSSSTPANTPPAQDSRVLGLAVVEVPSVTYSSAYTQAMALGVREVSVSLDWSILEPTEGDYNNALASIIDTFYPLQTGDISLVLRPLDTVGARVPSDLAGLDFDDQLLITAFGNFLTNLHAQLSTLNASGKLKWIHVGNEIDATLVSNSTKWAQWTTFFNAAKTKIESLWGTDIVVSSIIQFSTLKNTSVLPEYLKLLPSLDSAVLTYYPLESDFTMKPVSSVASDFDLMASTIVNKSIILQECGYSSRSGSGSSEALQADFITAVFKAWDARQTRISLIDFTWQYDVSEAQADQWVIDYGMSGNINEAKFKNYLWGLGLSNYDSSEKLALQRLKDELQARLWGQ